MLIDEKIVCKYNCLTHFAAADSVFSCKRGNAVLREDGSNTGVIAQCAARSAFLHGNFYVRFICRSFVFKPQERLRSLERETFLSKFTLFELILLALIAACGIAVKPVVVALSHLITGPLLIPGGALAGGFYMLFIVLGGALVGKRGGASLICFIQSIVVLVSGVYGSHGAASLITYFAPGLLVDLLWILCRTDGAGLIPCFLGGITANVSGTVLVNIVFFRMPVELLLFITVIAALSGGLGGIIAWQIVKHFRKLNIFSQLSGKTKSS
jgi:hypothetical protein